MTMPEVSIVCTVYKRPQYLVPLMESIFAQTLTNWELILVDDGSDMQELTDMCRRYAQQDKRVRYIQLPQNSGVSVARNRGIAEAKANFVAIQDDDDLMHPQRLQKQVGFLQKNRQVAVAMCYGGIVDNNGIGVSVRPQSDVFSEPRIYKPTPPLAYFIIPGTGLCFCRQRFIDAGSFCDAYDNGAEDIELMLRLEEKVQIALLREDLYFVRKHHDGHLSQSIYIWKYALLVLIAAYYRRAGLPQPASDEQAILTHTKVLPHKIIFDMSRKARGGARRLLLQKKHDALAVMLEDFHAAFSFNKKYIRKMNLNLVGWCLYYRRFGALPAIIRSMFN